MPRMGKMIGCPATITASPSMLVPNLGTVLASLLLLAACGGDIDKLTGTLPDGTNPTTDVESGPDVSSGETDPAVSAPDIGEPPGTEEPTATDGDTMGGDSSPDPASALELIRGQADLSLLAEAIGSTGFADYLDTTSHRTTIFAPSNTALGKLSTLQRETLLGNPAQLEALLRSMIVDDRVITISSAALGQHLLTVDGSTLQVVVVDGTIQVSRRVSRPVVSSVTSTVAAIHLIDDLMVFVDTDYFTPDPGSVTDYLQALPEYSRFVDILRRDPLYVQLGDLEKRWILLVPPAQTLDPASAVPFRLADHIVEHHGEDIYSGASMQPVQVTAVSRNVLEFVANSDGQFHINGVDITRLAAHEVAGSTVHEIGFPIQVNGDNDSELSDVSTLALVDRLGESQVDYKTIDEDAGYDLLRTPYRFFAALIRAVGQEERFTDPAERLTLLVPGVGISTAEIDSRFDGGFTSTSDRSAEDHHCYCYRFGDPKLGHLGDAHDLLLSLRLDENTDRFVPVNGHWPSMYRSFEKLGTVAETMIPDIFANASAARTFLDSHTVGTLLRELDLADTVGAELRSIDDTLLPVSAVSSEAGDGYAIGGEPVLGTPWLAQNGTIVRVARALTPTPDVYGLDDLVPPPPGSVLEALQRSDVHSIFLKLVMSNPDMRYRLTSPQYRLVTLAPTDAAFAAIGIKDVKAAIEYYGVTEDEYDRGLSFVGSQHVFQSTESRLATSALSEGVTLRGAYDGIERVVNQTESGLAIDGAALTFLGRYAGGDLLYSLDGLLDI